MGSRGERVSNLPSEVLGPWAPPQARQGRAPLTWRWSDYPGSFPLHSRRRKLKLGSPRTQAPQPRRRGHRPRGEDWGGRAPRATQDPPAPKTFGCEMCNLPGVSCAGRERRGTGKKGGGGEDIPASSPLLTSKVKDPDRSPGRGLPAAGGSPIPRPRTPNPGSPGPGPLPRTPASSPGAPVFRLNPTPPRSQPRSRNPGPPTPQSPHLPPRTRAPPGSRGPLTR